MRILALGLISGALALSVGCGSSGLPVGVGGGQSGTGGAPVTSSSSATGASSTASAATSTGGSTTAASSSASSTSSASSSASASSSGGLDGGVMSSGDCTTDADCPGGKCVGVTPGGFRVCQVAPDKAVTCDSPGLDQCCPTMGVTCPNNAPCYAGPLLPFCAGIPMQPHNQCAVDQCTQDADCTSGQICTLAGTLGRKIRACMTASCKLDADCVADPGGICAPVMEPCCGVVAGLFCVYPNSGCRSNADCPPLSPQMPRYCQPDATTGVAACQSGGPICPV
jgi:hypothetical protein